MVDEVKYCAVCCKVIEEGEHCELCVRLGADKKNRGRDR